MQGWDDPVKWDSLPQGGMARSWDTPAKLALAGQMLTEAQSSGTNNQELLTSLLEAVGNDKNFMVED